MENKEEFIKYIKSIGFKPQKVLGTNNNKEYMSIYIKVNLTIHVPILSDIWSVSDQKGVNIITSKEDFLNKYPFATWGVVTDTILLIEKDGECANFTFKEIFDKVKIELTDFINIEKDPGYYSENNSWSSFSKLEVNRNRFQTEEERKITKNRIKELREISKKERYNQYLKLKKEFENGQDS